MAAGKTATDVATDAPRPHQGLIKSLREQAALEASMGGNANIGFELAAKAIDNIAEASSLDELFDANESSTLPGVESVDGKPITLLEISFSKSREEFAKGGLGVFAHVDAVDDLGEQLEFTVGSPNVVATLYKIQDLGLMSKAEKPRIVIKGRQATNGVLYLVRKP